jgi:hypothetical protein
MSEAAPEQTSMALTGVQFQSIARAALYNIDPRRRQMDTSEAHALAVSIAGSRAESKVAPIRALLLDFSERMREGTFVDGEGSLR